MKFLLTYLGSNELKLHMGIPKRLYNEDLVLDDWLFCCGRCQWSSKFGWVIICKIGNWWPSNGFLW